MLKQNTVLVLGAGASVDAEMPIGSNLANIIASNFYFEFNYGLTKGDHRIFSILKRKFPENEVLNTYLNACRRIHDGVVAWRSIDNYIDAHKSDVECNFLAKLGITEAILRAERKSNLFTDRSVGKKSNFSGLVNSWYDEFASVVFQNVVKADLNEAIQRVKIVSFNYDRCFQQAMALWIERAYHVSFSQACEYISSIEIVHPYGSVGKFCNSNVVDGVSYGAAPSENEIPTLAENIRTYSEQIVDVNFLQQIKNIYSFADSVFYLGCAYHPQNLELLKAPQNNYEKFIAGTAMGISEDALEFIGEQLVAGMFTIPNGFSNAKAFFPSVNGNQIRLHFDKNCLSMIKYYRQRITAYS